MRKQPFYVHEKIDQSDQSKEDIYNQGDQLRFMDEAGKPPEEKPFTMWLKIIVCLILFGITIVALASNISEKNIAGIIAQFQVMISTYLVVSVKKKGYIIAVFVNVLEFFLVLIQVFARGNQAAVPGLFVPIGTIITISIIMLYEKKLTHRLQVVIEQKEELTGLYEELIATEEEIEEKNHQLVKYNDMMKDKEAKLNSLAYIDVLTEIPNRKMIVNRLELLSIVYSNKKEIFSLVLIDMDNFKRINDTKGHQVGDRVLQTIVSKIKVIVNEDDFLGRLGGDEFALIIQQELREEEIFAYVEAIRKILTKTMQLGEDTFNMSASFGVAMYPKDGSDAIELLKSAETAMYKAKERGKNEVQFFNHEMHQEILEKIEFENRLMMSLRSKELKLAFQPQYTLDKKLKGFEALCRWNSPELGNVSPLKFIPVAEETGFIVKMGEWVLQSACNMIKHIQETYGMELVISVNVSSVQIMDPLFVPMVKKILSTTGVMGHNIELEITESVFISSMNYVVEVIDELRASGVRIALDDFGTGYTSLSYLQRLPIDLLKIDKSFIDSINTIEEKKQIIGSIIALVHNMEIQVVAEGVETEKQLDYLVSQSCDFIQGFIWGKPLFEKELFELLELINP
jgi:diguanylate cyclase (GGDEF)-like protein